MEARKDGVCGISEVVLCCWGGMSTLGRWLWMSQRTMGNIPDILMRDNLDDFYAKESIEGRWEA